MSVTKSWFTTSNLSPHFQHFQHCSKTTSYRYISLTRKPRPTHYSALHHKNSTAYHNIMTSRITPTRPLPNTLSLYLMCSVIFIGHLSWTVLGICFINSPSTTTDLRAINITPTRSEHLAGRAETTRVTANCGHVTGTTVTSPLIVLKYHPILTMTLSFA